MRLTQTLLGYLDRAFRRDPLPFLALRLRYDGAMLWRVAEARLTTEVVGGTGAPLDVDLTAFSLAELAVHLADQTGYTVAYQAPAELAAIGARTLLDGEGDQDTSNGDHLRAYTAIEYAYFESLSVELKEARVQIGEMLAQMTTVTAQDEWLDEIGGYYGVRRLNNEPDALYGPRIVYEVIRPRNNNKAIEIAIREATGDHTTEVVDVVELRDAFPTYRGDQITHDGSHQHQFSGQYRGALFDVERDFPMAEGNVQPDEYIAEIKGLIDQFRSAGTHLRRVLLRGVIADDYPTGEITEGMSAVAIWVPLLEDLFGSALGEPVTYDGEWFYNDQITYTGGTFYAGRQVEQNPHPVVSDLDYSVIMAPIEEMFAVAEDASITYDGQALYNGNYRYGPTSGNDFLDLIINYHNQHDGELDHDGTHSYQSGTDLYEGF